MTGSSIDSEGWVDVLWIGDEETPSEVSSTTDSEFEIIGSSFDASSTSGNNAVLTKLRRPLPADPITSFATHKGATIKKNLYNSPYFAAIYDDKKLDSNQIQQPWDGNSTFDIGKWFEPGGNLEVGFKSNDNTTNVVGQKLPRHTPTKYDPMWRHPLKFDHKFGRRPYQPPLQQGGDAAPNEDRDFEALLEGPGKSCHLDEVDFFFLQIVHTGH